MEDFTGEVKAQHRTRALNYGLCKNNKNPYFVKTAIMLPGPQSLCLTQAVTLNLIDHRTKVHAAEKDPETYTRVLRDLKTKYHKKEIGGYTLNRDFLDLAQDILKNKPFVDYAFLDFCGQLTYPLQHHLKRLFKERFACNARLAVTLSAGRGTSPLISHNLGTKHTHQPAVTPNTHWNERSDATLAALKETLPVGSFVDSVYQYVDKVTPMILVLLTVKNTNPSVAFKTHKFKHWIKPRLDPSKIQDPKTEGQYFHEIQKEKHMPDQEIARMFKLTNPDGTPDAHRVFACKQFFKTGKTSYTKKIHQPA